MSTSSTVTRSSQAASQITEFRQSASSASHFAENANYDFIALLGLVQRLRVDFLPLTSQTARGSLEDGIGARGGQAKIYQSYVNPKASFAFKQFSRNTYHEIVSELLVLTHKMVRKHPYIVRLEGLCWDVRDDDDIRPVLVFEMSPLGDLYHFLRTDLGKKLSINDRLHLGVEIGIAIRDMHANNIIHGDIKPRNVLIFETSPSRYTARIGDFGFSTRFRGEDDLIYMPRSRIWHAPEWHNRAFRPEDSKRMDVFSFGMLCLWMLFGVDLKHDSTRENMRLISFEEDCDSSSNFLERWKSDNATDELTTWATSIISDVSESKRIDITSFFELSLAKVPQKRELNFDRLVKLLDPARHVWGRRLDVSRLFSPQGPAWNLPKAKTFTIEPAPLEEIFKISTSFHNLFLTDFRIPPFIVAKLKLATAQPQRCHRISAQKAALQLALSHATGFGVPQDEELALQVLVEYGLNWIDLESQVRAVREHEQKIYEGGLFSELGRRGFAPGIDFARHYQEINLLERARTICERDLAAVENVFHRQHYLYIWKKADLAYIMMTQDRKEEVEQILIQLKQLVELSTRTQGPDYLQTLVFKSQLAGLYRKQGDLTRALELDVEVFEKTVRVLGPEHPRTLENIIRLESTNWERRGSANVIPHLVQTVEMCKKELGPEHWMTLSSMVQLGNAYREQGQLMKSEETLTQVVQTTKKVLGEQHPDTLTSMDQLVSTYLKQGKRSEAAELQLQLLKIRKTVLGLEHKDTLASMTHLALTYRDQGQGQWTQAEDLFTQALKQSRRMLGEEHLSTLVIINNLGALYWKQKRWTEAEELYLEELRARKKVLGGEHKDTLTCMENLAWIYQKQGRREDAKRGFLQVVEVKSRILGPENPATLDSMENLQWV